MAQLLCVTRAQSSVSASSSTFSASDFETGGGILTSTHHQPFQLHSFRHFSYLKPYFWLINPIESLLITGSARDGANFILPSCHESLLVDIITIV